MCACIDHLYSEKMVTDSCALHKMLLVVFFHPRALTQSVYAMPALISHASGFCALYCTYGRATWGKSACTKLFIATLQM